MSTFAPIIVIFIFLMGLPYAAAWFRIMGNRVKKAQAGLIEETDIPQVKLICIEEARQPLLELGFVYSHASFTKSIYEYDDYDKYYQIYIHKDSNAFAAVCLPALPNGRQPFSVTYITAMKNGDALVTVDGMAHLTPPGPPWYYLKDFQLGDLTKQWAAHKAEAKSLSAATEFILATRELFLENEIRCYDGLLSHLESVRHITPDDTPDRWRFTASGAWVYAKKIISGSRTQAQLDASRAKQSPMAPKNVILASELEAFDRHTAMNEKRAASDKTKFLQFLLSVLLFLVAMGLFWSWSFAVIILGILMLHEFGHLAAMSIFGYKNRQVLFVPFLGAVAMGKKDDATAIQKLAVLFAGPVPGIILGLLFVDIYYNTDVDVFLYMGAAALVVNYLNLLPITPFDGGRIMDVLFFERFPRAQFFFFLSSILVMAAGAMLMQAWIFFVVIAFLALGIPHRRQMGAVSARATKMAPSGSSNEELKKTAILSIYDSPIIKKPFVVRYRAISAIVENLGSENASLPEILIGAVCYVFALFIPVWYVIYKGILQLYGNL